MTKTKFYKSTCSMEYNLEWDQSDGNRLRANISMENNMTPVLRIDEVINESSTMVEEIISIRWKKISELASLGMIRGVRSEEHLERYLELRESNIS